MTGNLKPNPVRFSNHAYFRANGTDEWINLGSVSPPEPTDGPVEVRRRIPVTKILSRSGGVEVDVTDNFDLEYGITLTAAFPTMEEAQAFDRKWRGKEDT